MAHARHEGGLLRGERARAPRRCEEEPHAGGQERHDDENDGHVPPPFAGHVSLDRSVAMPRREPPDAFPRQHLFFGDEHLVEVREADAKKADLDVGRTVERVARAVDHGSGSVWRSDFDVVLEARRIAEVLARQLWHEGSANVVEIEQTDHVAIGRAVSRAHGDLRREERNEHRRGRRELGADVGLAGGQGTGDPQLVLASTAARIAPSSSVMRTAERCG